MVNRRTHAAPRRGLPAAQAPSAGHLAGGGYSLHSVPGRVASGAPGRTRTRSPQGRRHRRFRYSRGCGWRAGPDEIHAPRSRSRCAAVRSSVRGIPGSAAVLCRRPNPARATTGATRAVLPGDAFARSRSPGAVSAWVAHAVPGVFEMRCFARRRRSVVRWGRATRRHNAPCRLHRTRQVEPAWVSDGAARRVPGTGQEFVARWRGVVEPALYTVEGRQTGDLRQKCGSALIRKAKLPARIVWKAVPFQQGRLTDRI
jgi:hypothetical protein